MKPALSLPVLFFASAGVSMFPFSNVVHAQAAWKNPVDGDWSDKDKWAGIPAQVPPAGGNASFGGPAGSSYTVTVNGNTIQDLGVGAAKITFNLAGGLTVTGTLAAIPASEITLSGAGAMTSGKINLNGAKFTISQASVNTGDLMSGNGGMLFVQNGGSLTSGANTITSAGFFAAVDGTGSKWTNTGLLKAAGVTVTNGGSIQTDSASVQSLAMTAGNLKADDLVLTIGNVTLKQGSTLTTTTSRMASPGTLDASTWDNSAGKFTKELGTLTMTGAAHLSSQSAALNASGGVIVKGSGTVWNNARDLTVGESSVLNSGLQVDGGGKITTGGNLFVTPGGFVGLNYSDSTSASRLEVTGKVDLSSGQLYENKNATVTSAGVVTRAVDTGGTVGSSDVTIGGTWTNTGDFVVGEGGQNAETYGNSLRVNGTLTASGDLIFGKQGAQTNTFYMGANSTVTDVNGVLSGGAGTVTNAFVGFFGGTSVKWTNSGTLIVADAGKANLDIDTGGMVTSAATTVGNQAGSNGSVGVRVGGKMIVNGNLTIGAAGTAKGAVAVSFGGGLIVTGSTLTLGRDAGSTGKLSLDNGGGQGTQLDFGGDLQVGLAGNGTLELFSGFQLDQGAKSLVLGAQANSSGTLRVSGDGSVYKSSGLTLGPLGVGILNIDGKGMVQTAGDAVVGEKAGGDGTATLTGSGSKWQVDGNLIIGKGGSSSNNAVGTVSVSDNTTLTVNGARLVLGQETGSRGTLIVDGMNAKVEGPGGTSLEIGRHGTGTLQLQNHAQLTIASTTLGVQSDGTGRITVTGTPSGQPTLLTVTGSLTVSGASAGVAAGVPNPGSKGGELDISGGGKVNQSGNFTVARDAGSTGSVELSGKGSALDGVLDAVVGQSGTGIFNISSGAAFTANSLVLGQNQGSDGTMHITGSKGTDDATLHLTTLIVGNEGTGRLFLENGATLDQRFLVVRIGDRQYASGQLTVDGAGSLLNVAVLRLGDRGGDGQLKILNGGTVNAGLSADTGFTSLLDTGGSILIGGMASTLTTPNLVLEGSSAGLPGLSITAGGSAFVTGADDALEVGTGHGGIPTASIKGEGAQLTVANGTTSVNGSLAINEGGSATLRQLEISSPGGEASVSVGGDPAKASTLTVPVRLNVGAQGQRGTLDIGGGGQVTTGLRLNILDGDVKVHGQEARLAAGDNMVLTFGNLNVSDGGSVSLANTLSALGGKVSLFGNGARLSAGSISLGGGSTFAITGDSQAAVATSLMIGQGSSLSNGGGIAIGTTLAQAPEDTIMVGPFGRLLDNGEIFGQVVTLPGGKVSGTGTINGKLINGGKVAPGDPQTLTVNGDYQQLSTGLLQIAINGTAAEAMDHLIVTGGIVLQAGAKLVLDFIDGFAPEPGNVFDFLRSGLAGITGNFSTVTIQGLAPGFQYTLGTGPSGSYRLTALNGGVSVPRPDYALTELPPVDSVAARTAGLTFHIPETPPAEGTYLVRASSDLMNWTTIATRTGNGPWTGPASVTMDAPQGGILQVKVIETLPLDTGNRFHRLETAPSL